MSDTTKSVDELFTNNFHEWLEQNGCTYIGIGNDDGNSIRYQIDMNRLKAAITQAKKDLLAEVRDLQRYKWMCETLHGGYNANEKDVYAALKRYSEREDLREDFAAFFESSAIKEIEEGL